MADAVLDINGTTVLVCATDGKTLGTERDATDLISDALSHGATLVAIPAERLDEAFFQLRTRVLGEFVQKFVNYQLRLAIVGDVARHVEQSAPLHDFVYEANRGQHVWFVAGLDELREKILRSAADAG